MTCLIRCATYKLRIAQNISNDWKKINRRALYRAITKLYKTRLIDVKENTSGIVTMMLTENGKKKALSYHIETIRVKPMLQWDTMWRIVIFDIPEKHKRARDAFARTLKNMGFFSLQKSIFIHPFECENELNFAIEFFQF